MPLADDLAAEAAPTELSRRKALGLIGTAALCAAGLGSGVVGVSYLSPNVLFEPSPLVRVGKVTSFRVGMLAPFPWQKVYLRRTPGGLYAMSAVCTHLGCMTRFRPRLGRIECPCHGSVFDLDGKVVKGPAPRGLPHYRVRIADQEVVVVDTSETVPSGELVRV